VKNFTHAEFDSPDSTDSGSNMDDSFLRMLDSAREVAGTPFRINSGFRTPKHNEKVGGSENSSHLRGFAADIHVTSNSTRYIILEALLNVGFNRIGVADTFIHVDADPIKTKNIIWTYA
tara:strand:- start:357 stop:713 length:357 start_codon:yes stop_codon:yes gene_type:complete